MGLLVRMLNDTCSFRRSQPRHVGHVPATVAHRTPGLSFASFTLLRRQVVTCAVPSTYVSLPDLHHTCVLDPCMQLATFQDSFFH